MEGHKNAKKVMIFKKPKLIFFRNLRVKKIELNIYLRSDEIKEKKIVEFSKFY